MGKKTKKKIIIPDVKKAQEEYNPIEKLLTRDPQMLWKVAGTMVRLAGKTSAGRSLLQNVGKVTGALIAKTGMFGVKKGKDAMEVVNEWLKVLTAVGCEFEIGRSTKNEVEIFILDCPAGLCTDDGREVCNAGMSADRELVRRLGGELIIGDTIASGATHCHLTVRT